MERLIYVARLNAGEMLRDRGYEIPIEITEIPFSEFQERATKRGQIDLYGERSGEDSDRIYVKFIYSTSSRKMSPSSLEKETSAIATSVTDSDVYKGDPRIIFVTEESPQSNVELILKNMYPTVEVMTYNHLQINPTKHSFVPKHELVPREEEASVLEKYNCLRKNIGKEFPRILSSDPIARWYGMRSGRICRIQRVSEQSGRHIHYRYVV